MSLKKSLLSLTTAALLVSVSVPLVSAAPLLEKDKPVAITVDCDKKGYTFELFEVAKLDTKTTTIYETGYTPFFDEIADEIKSGKTKDILGELDSLSTLPEGAKSCGTYKSTDSSTHTFENLEQGIYYVRCVSYPAGVKRVENSVVALPYYNSEWVYDIDNINLAEKVQDDKPKTEKVITNSTIGNDYATDAGLGSTVDFKISSTTAGSASLPLSKFVVNDDMDKGLTLDNNSFTVYLANAKGETLKTLNNNTDYELTIENQKDGENTLFDVALSESFLSDVEGENTFYDTDVVYCCVTYSATVNKYAIKGEVGIPNTHPELVYGNKSSVDSVPGNKVYVYTWGAKVNKVDENGEALAGAKFSIYKTEEDAKNMKNELASGVSDSNGNVDFLTSAGVEISLAKGDYFIRETEAPATYNVYSQVIPITIDVTYSNTFNNNTWVANCPKNGYATVTVSDTHLTLPKTGGYVNFIYLAGAVSLISGAVLLLFAKKLPTKTKTQK